MKPHDKLEEFIQKNRNAFDDAYPSLKIWSDIEKDLDRLEGGHGKGSSWIKNLLIGLVVIAVSVALVLFIILKPEPSVEKNFLFAELESMQHYYELEAGKMIKTVGNDINILENPDLQEIEKSIAEIKEELGDIPQGSEELALKALLESYHTKLLIIERILEHYELSHSQITNENTESVIY